MGSENNMVAVPEEAVVEQCAKAMWRCDEHWDSGDTWKAVPDYGQDLWRDRARACLDTAARLASPQPDAQQGEATMADMAAFGAIRHPAAGGILAGLGGRGGAVRRNCGVRLR